MDNITLLKDGRRKHLHEADPAAVEVLQVNATLRERAAERPHRGPSRIIKEVIGQMEGEEILARLPERNSLKRK